MSSQTIQLSGRTLIFQYYLILFTLCCWASGMAHLALSCRCRKQLTFVLACRLIPRHTPTDCLQRPDVESYEVSYLCYGQFCNSTYWKHISMSPVGARQSLLNAQIHNGKRLIPLSSFLFFSLSLKETGGLMGWLTSFLFSWHV